MTVKLLAPYGPYLPGDLFAGYANTEAGLIQVGMATADTTGGVKNVTQVLEQAFGGKTGGRLPWRAVLTDRVLTAFDDQQYLGAAAPLTITVPSGLSPRPTLCLLPPTSGNLTVTGNINGQVQSLILVGSPNVFALGWCLCANVATDGYTLLANH